MHLYPHLSQRGVYARLVSGLRAIRDDVPEAIPLKSAFSYRREQLGSANLQELFARCAGPQADEQTHRPFPQARLVLVVECGTHLICDAEISECRQAEASSTRALLARWKWENCLVLWESGFHSHEAIFALRDRNGPRCRGA